MEGTRENLRGIVVEGGVEAKECRVVFLSINC